MKSTIDTDVKSVEVERFNEHKVIPTALFKRWF